MRAGRTGYRYQRLQLLDAAAKDAYRPGGKPRGPVRCAGCGAVFRKGRWSWGTASAHAPSRRCPACRRIAENFPGGYVSIGGAFVAAHRAEVIARMRRCEAEEKAEHPLERIMAIAEREVTTTSPHLARRIGHALRQSFKGELTSQYGRGDNVARIRWHRD